MVKTIEVLVPTAKPKIKEIQVNSQAHDLNGKVVGFLWDEKTNGDVLLNRIREHLLQKYKLAGTVWKQIGGLHVKVEDAPGIEQLATAADTVIIAIGD